MYKKSYFPILEAKRFDDWGIHEDGVDINENTIFDSSYKFC